MSGVFVIVLTFDVQQIESDRSVTSYVRNVLFNDALNTFYLRLYGVRHVVKDHSDSERVNPLPLQCATLSD